MIAQAVQIEDRRPAFVRALEAVGGLSGLSMAERSALMAALRWVNFRTGELWPSVREWSEQAGITERGLQGIIRKLGERGVLVTVTASKGGRGQTSVYRIPALAVDANPERGAGVSEAQTPNGDAETPNAVLGKDTGNPERHDRNPERGGRNPEQLVRTNSQEQPRTATDPARAPIESKAAGHRRDRRARLTDEPPGFTRFADAYPPGKLGNKAVARGIWEDLGLEHAADGIVAAVETLRTSRQWTEQEGRYIPSGATFLGGEKWKGVKVKAKNPHGEVASDADQAAFRAWWAKLGEQPREVFSRHYGATAATVTQWVSWGHVRTAMVERMRKEQDAGADARG